MSEIQIVVLYVLGAAGTQYALTRNIKDQGMKRDAWIHAAFWPVVWIMVALMIISDFLHQTFNRRLK